jgi:catalase
MKTKRLVTALTMLMPLVAGVAALPAAAEDPPVATQAVDALNKVYGTHPGFRANHAKGVVVAGSFKASPEAAKLSKAILFSGKNIPVTVRFSDAGGVPNIPDGSPDANPHGMAIKYHQPNGSETDMVIVSLKFFPVATGEDFRDLLLAIADSPPGAPKPTRFEQFVAAHPAVPQAFDTAHTPDSFAHEVFYGIDAFVLVDKAGKKQPVRYIMQPEKVVHLSAEDAAKQAPDFLVNELPTRIAKHPVVFHLKAQLAAPNDQTKDPTQPWPDDRKVVDLGTLTLNKPVDDGLAAQKKLLFLPGNVTDGIELSDDPLLGVRNGAYAVSYSRRSQNP